MCRGNIPELNGILRNDKTEEDLSAWERSDIKLRKQYTFHSQPSQSVCCWMAFKMFRDGTFDNIAVNDLVNVIQASSNKTMGLNGVPFVFRGKNPTLLSNTMLGIS